MILSSLSLLALTATFCWNGPAAVQDPLRPAPQHAVLLQRVGTWDAVLTLRDQTGKSVEWKGTLTVRKHAEFHTVDEYEGECMGLKLVGIGLNSWCPIRKQFLSTWTDSMTPAPMLLRGSYDEKKRELVMTGECFGRSGKLEPCRTVTTFQDDQHHEWKLLGKGPEAQESELVRITYTRRK